MTNKLTKITLLSALVLGGIAFGTLADAQDVASRADVEFKAPGPTTPVDPSDPEDVDPKPVLPTDPTDPTAPVYPGGALRLNHVPTISFGVNNVSSKTANYFGKLEKVIDFDSKDETYKASYVEVADESGVLKGWTVNVSSDGIFKPTKGVATENINAAITLSDAQVRGINGMEAKPEKAPTANSSVVIGHGAPAASAQVMTAETGKGYNKWQVRYGHSTTSTVVGDDASLRNPAVKLTVPQGQAIIAGEAYSASVVWTLQQGI